MDVCPECAAREATRDELGLGHVVVRFLCGRTVDNRDDGMGNLRVCVRKRCVSSLTAALRFLDRRGVEGRKYGYESKRGRIKPRIVIVRPASARTDAGRFQAAVRPPAIQPTVTPPFVMSKKNGE